MATGVIVFAHGSSVASANEAVERVAAAASQSAGFPLYETAFLDALPNLRTASRKLIERGASRILVIPYFLTLGIHLKRDLPALAREIESEYPNLEVVIAPPLDGHPALSEILADRAKEMLGAA
jgi:sirohydrochlorin ferrochelatase